MLALILTAVLSVAIHSIVLSTLINRYYISFSTESYNEHVTQLLDFSEKVLSEADYSEPQLAMHYETHLSDPLTRIRLYDETGSLLVDVQADSPRFPDMMDHGMMSRIISTAAEETESFPVDSPDGEIGRLLITKISSPANYMASRMFTLSLIGNSLLSFGLVFVLILLIGFYMSRKLSRDLKVTAKQAVEIGLENKQMPAASRIREIRTIQQSLEELHSRLQLRQVSRKKLVDELIHQTRTPLTILKTHLEGLADNIIELTPAEIKTCEIQVEAITAMISNIGGLIDAGADADTAHLEKLEIRQLLRQIAGSLKVQFAKKNIELEIADRGKVELESDYSKLSQAIYNVLTNAYKFTSEGGRVTIDYFRMASGVSIVIQDTGAGISEVDQARIFDAYYRGSNTGTTTGDGIGLYITREILQKIGGRIEVESEVGLGSKFIISLPQL